MRAFINTILGFYKNYVIILGDMGELGDKETDFHKELGVFINNAPNLSEDAVILSIGKLSELITNEITNCKAIHFNTIEAGIEYIKNNINKNKTLFLKASRSMQFENIVSGLAN